MTTTQGNVLLKLQVNNKETYKFSNGVEIILPTNMNYNLREANPTLAEVIDCADIPAKSLVLIHHNANQDSYKVFEEGDNIFSVPMDMVFLYNEGNGWLPNKDFLISYRIFRKYEGLIIGVEPELIKNRLYIVKGEVNGIMLDGKTCAVTSNSDYQIIFHENGRPNSIIRTRSREILAEDIELGTAIKEGKYLLGITSKDAKTLN